MVTQITLGSFFSANNRRVLGGIGGSGLDTQALIEGLTAARAAPAEDLQEKITKNGEVTSALRTFQQLLSSFQTSLDALRNPPGVNNAANNAFAYNSATLASNTSVSGSTYLSVSAEPGAALQNYDITYISSIAKATKQTTGTFVVADANTTGIVVSSAPAAGQFKAGTFTVNGESITLTENDTLNSIAAKFNAIKADTGISAAVIKVSDGNYKINFAATATGTANDFDLESGGTVTDASGVLAQIAFTDTQDAANAVFRIDGVEITRSSNVITDVVDGLTFTLLQETPDDPLSPPPTPTTINVAIEPDTATAKAAIIAFANSYNEIRAFAAQQLETKADGTFAETAVLARNSVFRTTLESITSQVTNVVTGATFTNISDIGMSFITSPATEDTPEVPNVLTINESELDSALVSDYDAVRGLFEFTMTSDNPNLRVFSRTNALAVSEFTLELNPFASQSTGTITVADADTAITFFSPTSGQFSPGDITVNGEVISIADGDTLNQIANKFNTVSATTGLAATVVNISAGEYKLTFAATPQSGKNNLFNLESDALDPDGAMDLLGLTATGTFQVTYDDDGTPTTIDIDAEAINGTSSYFLEGVDGTVLEGLKLIYSSAAAVDIDVVATQGIADSIYNTSEAVLADTTGSLDIELASIQDEDDRLNDQIERINEQVAQYRDMLLQKFAALEQAIANTNNLLQSLDANDQARRQG